MLCRSNRLNRNLRGRSHPNQSCRSRSHWNRRLQSRSHITWLPVDHSDVFLCGSGSGFVTLLIFTFFLFLSALQLWLLRFRVLRLRIRLQLLQLWRPSPAARPWLLGSGYPTPAEVLHWHLSGGSAPMSPAPVAPVSYRLLYNAVDCCCHYTPGTHHPIFPRDE
jgi:hypothetical protein